MERWLPVVGYEGLYEVSDHGRVRSLAENRPRNWQRRKVGILKPILIQGYHCVGLSKDSEPRRKLIHRLVLLAFIGPCPAGFQAAHNNGTPNDNRLENLRWASAKENQGDRKLHGTSFGGKPFQSEVRARLIIELGRSMSVRRIAGELGVSRRTVGLVLSGRSWKHLPRPA